MPRGGSKPGRRGGFLRKDFHLRAPTLHPSIGEIKLAAGWYEGEGWCGDLQVEIGQKDPDQWMVQKLRSWFGGSISHTKEKDFWVWVLNGPRARGFLMTIYTLLSPRRQNQLRKVLLAQRRVSPGT